MMLALALLWGLGPSLTEAAEPPAIPTSFNEVAAAALAASFVIRIPVATAPAEDGAVQRVLDADEDIQEDGHEPLDAAAELRERTVGAGVIIDPRGVALTSTRVVLQAREFEVVMMDGTPVSATVVGLDLRGDVAVLKLDGRGAFFPHLPLGDSARVKIGDWLISVGAPLGLTGTVVAGVVTATPAPMSPDPTGSFLQSDAVMGLGNAGGPMINMSGEVVGLGTVLTTNAAAYAIPSNTLRRIARDMLEKGRVSRPWLGITTQSLNAALARALRARDDAGPRTRRGCRRAPTPDWAGAGSGSRCVPPIRSAAPWPATWTSRARLGARASRRATSSAKSTVNRSGAPPTSRLPSAPSIPARRS